MTPTLTRTTEEVFNSHREAIETLDFEKLAADYAEDAVMVTLDGSFIGREAILTGFFQPMLAQFPDIKINFEKTAVEDDVCLLQWSAEASAVRVPKGTAVFIVREGLIRRQGEWFEMVPKEA
jgi:ketosteroid isomerase-like protein